jgi:intracellular septation protein
MIKRAPPYFLLSFIPAVAYWLLETYSTMEIALVGGIVLGVLEMLLEKKITGHVHTLSKLNVSLIVALGGISLIAQKGIWFKLQPTMTGFAVGAFLLYQKFKGQSLMYQMLIDMQQTPPLPRDVYKKMEWHICLFLFLFALYMAHIAINETTARWLFWKTAGFYIAFGGFMVLEIIYLRWFLGRLKK